MAPLAQNVRETHKLIQSLEEGGQIWWASLVWRLFMNILFYLCSRKNSIVPDIPAYHSQESQQPWKRNTIKKYRRSDPIHFLMLWWKWSALSRAIYVTCIVSNICMKYMQLRSTHNHRFVCMVGWTWLYLSLGPPNCIVLVHLILPWIWNCFKDNKYVLLLYRIRLSRWLRLASFGISGNASADKSSLQDQVNSRYVLGNTFSCELFWSASRNCALTVLDFRFLRVLGSVRRLPALYERVIF